MNVTFWRRCETLLKHVNHCCSSISRSSGNSGSLSRAQFTRPPLSSVSYSVHRHFHLQSVCRANKSEEVKDVTIPQTSDLEKSGDIEAAVNTSINSEDRGRLFAVVHVAGSQKKVTVNDIIVVESSVFPTVGTRIRLEKVLLVGGKDFTLVGRPLLRRSVVNVEATVIEKTMSPMMLSFLMVKRRRVRRLKMQKTNQVVLLINSIEVNSLET
uniref:Large ribosomal subunit protein bL21m n=1 Tax=Crassostrea virginica TaxID=6565 RepID=A0A8B8BS28_CRAVI|nr:39S ribosomal protein L21, mitochondrial-like [Crassostrea virginica]